ncbi:uncharacterized protein [Gossypium hirsutum]|uniref:Zinc finger PMZ-type domain-containing protein n=1 Tax=Gossypium hirsutum TaxID=3635 RepID=A0A1U8J7T2_GOSHI|nr:uncharacterized protein LOC107902622 [Gossypium hirsutum]
MDKSWQLIGIPCPHACCAIYHVNEEPDDYLYTYYHKETYLKAYEYAMQAINGLHEWKKSGIQPVLPPIERNMPEGTKKNKRMAKDEPQKLKPRQLSRRGLVMNCRYCGEPGHNIKSKMDRSSWTLLCAVSYEHIAS